MDTYPMGSDWGGLLFPHRSQAGSLSPTAGHGNRHLWGRGYYNGFITKFQSPCTVFYNVTFQGLGCAAWVREGFFSWGFFGYFFKEQHH